MTLECTASAIRLEGGIDLKDDTGNLAPIRVVCLGIEKTYIGDGVSLVVRRELGLARRQICNRGIGLRHGMKLLQRRETSVKAMVAALRASS